MVPLIHGQAVIGGYSPLNGVQNKIHFITCANMICMISTLTQQLSAPIEGFVAIPIPDYLSGCISGGKNAMIAFMNNDKLF